MPAGGTIHREVVRVLPGQTRCARAIRARALMSGWPKISRYTVLPLQIPLSNYTGRAG